MSGIINSAGSSAPPSGAPDELSNPLLQEAVARQEAGLTAENRVNYLKTVNAGLHILLAKGVDGFLAKLRNSKDPISDCAKGAVALMLIMRKQAKGIMPMKAGIPAGMTLMFHGLDFVESAGIGKIAEPEIVRATHIFINTLFAKMGITPPMLQHAMGKVHQITQDPKAMNAINLKAGITRHPMAVMPTPLPPGPAPPQSGG